MPLTIQCEKCGVVLNLPDDAGGRRLKCPKCGAKFYAGGAPAPREPAREAPRNTQVRGPDSTFELSREGGGNDLPSMPNAPGDLRETFGLPLMTDAAGPGDASPGSRAPTGQPKTADATLLFEDSLVKPRRKTGGDARAKSRRCPTCGGVVPIGMSLCQTCGTDLETGARVDLLSDLAPQPIRRVESLPIALTVVGGICASLSGALALAALVGWLNGQAGLQYFIPIALFGVHASVQLLRRRSTKLLLIALTLGALIDFAGLIALPIYDAQARTAMIARTEGFEDPDVEIEYIKPLAERIDQQRITSGIAVLLAYAVISIYLLSPSVQRQFRK